MTPVFPVSRMASDIGEIAQSLVTLTECVRTQVENAPSGGPHLAHYLGSIVNLSMTIEREVTAISSLAQSIEDHPTVKEARP